MSNLNVGLSEKSENKADNKALKKLEKSNKSVKSGTSGWSKFLSMLQELGKALQFPIAVLPFAAILNRFGALGISLSENSAGDIVNHAGYWVSFIIQAPGAAAFNNLPLMFAIGVAFGLAKDHRGEVALVGALFYLVLAGMTAEKTIPQMLYGHVLTFQTTSWTAIFKDGVTTWQVNHEQLSSLIYVQNIGHNVIDPTTGKVIEKITQGGTYVLNIGVLGGIVAGCCSAYLYNRLKGIKLPAALSFFGGRRFVPMVGLVMALGVGMLFAIVWPWIQYVLMLMGSAVANPSNPAVAIPGTALYGLLNRLLLPFGLHQILNTFFWFQLPINGDKISTFTGNVVQHDIWTNGDINAFTAGNSNSGLFQSGFFPVMMGGIPCIALAMIFAAKKENRRNIAGFLGGVAGVSFISGITEPIEFSFVFLSPVLLLVHGCLTAIFVGVTTAMHIQVGFGFSAGFIDYCVSFAQSWGFAKFQNGAYHVLGNPLWIWPLTAICGVIYFFVFSILIRVLNVATPGREDEILDNTVNAVKESKASKNNGKVSKADKYDSMAQQIVDIIGKENFASVDNCATRLRLILKKTDFDDAKIKATGAFGVKRLGSESVQIVIGPDVEHVANAMKKILGVGD